MMDNALSSRRITPQRLNASHDAILAAGNSLDAMVAGGTERALTGATGGAGGIGRMEDTFHFYITQKNFATRSEIFDS